MIATIKTKQLPLVSVATSKSLSQQLQVTLPQVIDEIPFDSHYDMFTKLITVKKIALVYSMSEKVMPEVEKLTTHLRETSVTLQSLPVQNSADLYMISEHIDPSVAMIFVLKDHLVVSGIAPLVQVAQKHRVPLITSDEGSVHQGACLALAVSEKALGQLGSELVMQVLSGNISQRSPELPLEIFYSTMHCQNMGLEKEQILALSADYKLKEIN